MRGSTFSILIGVAALACRGFGPGAEGTGAVEPSASTRRVGLYEYMADAASFRDCGTEVRIPVATEGDNAALERAYLAARVQPGETMLVTLRGRVEPRPPMEGVGMRDSLIVTHFEQVWPSETCEKSSFETPLENTYWKLVELRGARVETHPDQPQNVHILLRTTERRMVGFAGCNDLTGGYETGPGRITFGHLVTTMRACPHLDEETTFTSALESVRRYQILGESLVLSSDTEDLARFQAVYFP